MAQWLRVHGFPQEVYTVRGVCGSSESTGFAACDHTLTHTRYLNPLHAKLTVVFLPDQSADRGATASVGCISLPAALYYGAGVMNDALVAINF